MSCDGNHDAQEKDRAERKRSRSLTVIGQPAPAPRAQWRSLEERDRLGAG